MGDMFRSEKMALCQMFIQPEAAYTSVSELGEVGCVAFRDLNDGVSAFQRKFVAEVRRCDEVERRIGYIESELKKDDVVIVDIYENFPKAPNPREFTEMEAELEKIENELLELNQNHVDLKSNFLELTELRQVLESTQKFYAEQEVIDMEANSGDNRGCLGFVSGVIERKRVFAFERMLWRISRGNIFLKRADFDEPIKDPTTGRLEYKTVFVAFFQGEQISTRVKKVCTGFHAHMYTCPISHLEREEMKRGVSTRLEDMKMVLSQTEDHRNRVLITVLKKLPIWKIMIKKMKAIYHTMNLFNIDVTEKCLIGECWVPKKDLGIVQAALADGSAAVGSTIPSFVNVIETNETPPTFNRTNKFTRGFQNLIDAYGVSTYREANPSLYTIITFPFLFGVMFGDMGHGFVLFLFGLWMCLFERSLGKKRGGEIWNIFFAGRYIILLLGCFSIYTGFMYNDIFSKSINVFGSTWRIVYNTSTVMSNTMLQLNPTDATVGTYVIGMDPIWQLAENKIIFLNTYKMKLSIIFGVVHMLFGVCMSVVNYNYFHRRIYIFLEFLPQILFLILLFGYMVFMMFYKWVRYSPKSDYLPDTPGCAPSVLIMFINMVLFKPATAPLGCDLYLFDVQKTLELAFFVVAIICIPWLLLGKPLYIQFTRRKDPPKDHYDEEENEDLEMKHQAQNPSAAVASDSHEVHNPDDEPMSEIYIHQAIHTIEYILSTISHTASYLRLWALSLAHAQLSEVLWEMVMTNGLIYSSYVGCIILFFIFAVWVFFTMAILVMMEGLSAFLHTLRLHWVEFMSKFYQGLGYAFQPFSFKVILTAEEDS